MLLSAASAILICTPYVTYGSGFLTAVVCTKFVFELHSRVNRVLNPKKIPSKGFIVLSDSAGHSEFQKKIYP